jgi:hypothetical protein
MSMKNILVAGDPQNPEYLLVNREASNRPDLGRAQAADTESVNAMGTDRASEENAELLEQLNELMVNSHMIDKIFNTK